MEIARPPRDEIALNPFDDVPPRNLARAFAHVAAHESWSRARSRAKTRCASSPRGFLVATARAGRTARAGKLSRDIVPNARGDDDAALVHGGVGATR